MSETHHETRRSKWFRYGFRNLLVWLLVFVVVGPFLHGLEIASTVLTALLTLALASALIALIGNRRWIRTLASITFLFAMLPMWLRVISPSLLPVYLDPLGLILFLCILVAGFAIHLARVRRVTTNVLCAALCLYLVIGMLFGYVFVLLETLAPGSFSNVQLVKPESLHELTQQLQYFSFVTLSTLGYGDITPQSPGAEAFCQFEAILGQFLTVVLVARLVGVQVAQETSNPND